MTKEIAIHNLFALKLRSRVTSDRQALDLAIKALEQQPCEDCISREVVMRILKTLYNFDDLKDLKVKQQEVMNLPSITPKIRWIPVSERLPEKVGVYLVSMNRLGYPQREVDGFVCGRWERFGSDVIAWCEIPEPYKESEEENEENYDIW